MLSPNVELTVQMEAKESRLFKVRVPSPSEHEGDEEQILRSVTILASPLINSVKNAEANLILAATAVQGETPSTNNHKSILGEPVW